MKFAGFLVIKFVYPVGALTSKPYVFGFRPWELKSFEIFNPMPDFYQPILVQVANNIIQRVLPSNSKIFEFYYNWISNQSRFFFEAFFSESNIRNLLPRFSVFSVWKYIGFSKKYFIMSRFVQKTWLTAITRVSLNFLNYSSFSMLVSNSVKYTMNLDLFTEFEFKNFCAQFLDFFGNFNSFYFYSEFKFSLAGLLNQELQFSQLLSKSYAQIFLISFNPYFSNPVLDYYLRESMRTYSTVIYTVFSSFIFGDQKFKNCLSTVGNLMSLFSGKHVWSAKLVNSTSLVIIDLLFVKTLPIVGMQLILKFIRLNLANVYLVNTHVFRSLPLESQVVNFVNYLDYSKIVRLIVVGNNMFSDYGKIFKFKNFYKQFFLTGLDYSHIFNCETVQFSEINSCFAYSGALSQIRVPVSAFLGYSTVYKFFNDPVPYWFTKVVEFDKRPFGQFLYLVSKRILDITCFRHFHFGHMRDSFLVFVILCQYFISWNFFEYIFRTSIGRNIVGYQFTPFIFSFQWYFDGKFYFWNSMNCNQKFKNFLIFSIKWMPIFYTTNIDLVSCVDISVKYSKTLSLDRAWRVSRFSNFILNYNYNYNLLYIYIYILFTI